MADFKAKALTGLFEDIRQGRDDMRKFNIVRSREERAGKMHGLQMKRKSLDLDLAQESGSFGKDRLSFERDKLKEEKKLFQARRGLREKQLDVEERKTKNKLRALAIEANAINRLQLDARPLDTTISGGETSVRTTSVKESFSTEDVVKNATKLQELDIDAEEKLKEDPQFFLKQSMAQFEKISGKSEQPKKETTSNTLKDSAKKILSDAGLTGSDEQVNQFLKDNPNFKG